MSLADIIARDAEGIFGETIHGFAVTATWKGTHTKQVPGVYDGPYVDVLSAESYAPRFTCATAVLPEQVAHGDTLTVPLSTGPRRFSVRGVQADGSGVTVLVLEESA